LAEIDPTALFPPATPFTLQVTVASELPVTVAAYCDCPPSMTLPGPVRVIDTVAESVPLRKAGLLMPHAVRTSTKAVVRIARGRLRDAERILSVLRPL
jgi:hypothetical protein